MKSKNIIMSVLLLIVIVAISGVVFLGIKYKDSLNEVENLKSEITKLNEQVEGDEVKEPEVEQDDLTESFKNVKYDSSKIVNSDSTYDEGCSIGSTRGNLHINRNTLTFEILNTASNYQYSITYDAKEPIIDAIRGAGGQGAFEITAIVTETGKVYINKSFKDDDENELTEVQSLPKICKVVYTTSTTKDGYFYGGTVIAIDEEGNGYDLLKSEQ